MRIELLYWEGCPSHDEARALVEGVLAESGVDVEVELREIVTQEQADAERFPGSPTIRIDGRDVDPDGAGGLPMLGCRIYRRADGRVSPVPERAQIAEALR